MDIKAFRQTSGFLGFINVLGSPGADIRVVTVRADLVLDDLFIK